MTKINKQILKVLYIIIYKIIVFGLILTSSVSMAQLPPLTPPADPPSNTSTPEKIKLGKILYWDEQLSSTKNDCLRKLSYFFIRWG